MRVTEVEHVIINEREICGDDKGKIFAAVSRFGLGDDEADQVEVKEGLASLKLDLDRGRWRVQGQVDRRARHFPGHVELHPVFGLPRDLAVATAMLTAKSDNEDVEACEFG
jgi:hypothetical protein